MSNLDKQQLETHIQRIFKYNKQIKGQSSKSRLRAILSRSLHELALRDIIIFFGALMAAAFMLFNSILKLVIRRRES